MGIRDRFSRVKSRVKRRYSEGGKSRMFKDLAMVGGLTGAALLARQFYTKGYPFGQDANPEARVPIVYANFGRGNIKYTLEEFIKEGPKFNPGGYYTTGTFDSLRNNQMKNDPYHQDSYFLFGKRRRRRSGRKSNKRKSRRSSKKSFGRRRRRSGKKSKKSSKRRKSRRASKKSFGRKRSCKRKSKSCKRRKSRKH